MQGPLGVNSRAAVGTRMLSIGFLCAEPSLSREFHWQEGCLGPGVELVPLDPHSCFRISGSQPELFVDEWL